MAKFKIQAGAEIDALSDDELKKSLDEQNQSWFREFARGLKSMRLTMTASVASGAVTLGGTEAQPFGPREGFVWDVRRLSVSGLAAGDVLTVWRTSSDQPGNLLGQLAATTESAGSSVIVGTATGATDTSGTIALTGASEVTGWDYTAQGGSAASTGTVALTNVAGPLSWDVVVNQLGANSGVMVSQRFPAIAASGGVPTLTLPAITDSGSWHAVAYGVASATGGAIYTPSLLAKGGQMLLMGGETLLITGTGLAATGQVTVTGEYVESLSPMLFKIL